MWSLPVCHQFEFVIALTFQQLSLSSQKSKVSWKWKPNIESGETAWCDFHLHFLRKRFEFNTQELVTETSLYLNFMLGWLCILNCMNNNQHDTLFIFTLLGYHTSACFGRISSPSSGGKYIYIYICVCVCVCVCGKRYLLWFWVDCHRTWPDDSQIRSMYNKYLMPHIYILLHDDRLLISPKHIQV
jgi:hypothetical protein